MVALHREAPATAARSGLWRRLHSQKVISRPSRQIWSSRASSPAPARRASAPSAGRLGRGWLSAKDTRHVQAIRLRLTQAGMMAAEPIALGRMLGQPAGNRPAPATL